MGDGAKRPRFGTGRLTGRRFVLGGALIALVGTAPSACGSKQPRAHEVRNSGGGTESLGLVPVACGEDQVREYRCESLLPLSSALPAPEPYGACPGALEIVDPVYVPLSKMASFDAPHTDFMRRRAPPGHQCCYSWCGRLDVARIAEVPPGSRCNQPLAFPEKLCMPEPESAVSTERAAAPFDRCAAAVRPPQAAVFSVPSAALLHPELTNERRGLGYAECCYAWCSIAPPGSGLERQR